MFCESVNEHIMFPLEGGIVMLNVTPFNIKWTTIKVMMIQNGFMFLAYPMELIAMPRKCISHTNRATSPSPQALGVVHTCMEASFKHPLFSLVFPLC